MSKFKRSSSKVWWASESLEWYEVSRSPGSLDSGYSDAETSPPLSSTNNGLVQQQQLPSNVEKTYTDDDQPRNLSTSYQEKKPLTKSFPSFVDTANKNATSPKTNRNLFSTDVIDDHQYSSGVQPQTSHNDKEITAMLSNNCTSQTQWRSSSLSTITSSKSIEYYSTLNKTAPVILQRGSEADEQYLDKQEQINGNHSLSSDCESELEQLFKGSDTPKHTSTPMGEMNKRNTALQRKITDKNLRESPGSQLNNPAVSMWLKDVQSLYEPECMTTLQAKSIAAELNELVNSSAAVVTYKLRNILSHSQRIEAEYNSLNSDGILGQTLINSIVDFMQRFNIKKYQQEFSEIKKKASTTRPADDEVLQLAAHAFNLWQNVEHSVLQEECQTLVLKFETPSCELNLRAAITGLTHLTLHYPIVTDILVKTEIIAILCVQCKKYTGSSMRCLLLRALTTVCNSSSAIQRFDKFAGVQLIADILAERPYRPETERSEAVALLVQVTAPWIEKNDFSNNYQRLTRALHDSCSSIVGGLTYFAKTTACCQNLLLCVAALANISSMSQQCVQCMLQLQTADTIVQSVRRRGKWSSPYLLEQSATLIANIACLETARLPLTICDAPAMLLTCLQWPSFNETSRLQYEDVAKRIQQKAIIGLSRLCSDEKIAQQIVRLDGVDKLVKMCRDKKERFDNDSVLVTALATLRKISSSCGEDAINTMDSLELVAPNLVDSFRIYSTQNESYV